MKLEDKAGEDYRNDTWIEKNVYISVNQGTDELSGHNSTTYRINEGEETKEAQILTESGIYKIVVTTTDNAGNTQSNSYTIKIRRKESLVVTTNPEKVEYKAYENFEQKGMVLSIKYDNGDIEETSDYRAINGEKLTCNVKKIEIQYNENKKIKVEIPIKVEHIFSQYISNNDATCTEDGTETAKCENCQETHRKADEGSKLGHNYGAKVTEATCTEKGYTTHTCTRCEYSYVDTYTDALGHSFTNYVSNKDATCTEDGTKTAKCERCDKTDTKVDEGSMLPHTEVIDKGKEATCTEAGITEGKHCSECNKVLVEQKEIPAKGHNYEEEVTEPTCLEKGYTTHTCTRCEDSYVDTYTDALGHSFTNYVSNKDATCTEDGTETSKCERCDQTDTKVDKGSKIAHNYENGTCTECGEKEDKLEITSGKYKIDNIYISKIQEKTTIKEFKEKIETNATEMKVYSTKGEEQEETKVIATGMKVELRYKNETKILTIVVAGDVNGDGNIRFSDMIRVNQHRLGRDILQGEYLLAADVTGEGKVNFDDMLTINRFRLHIITEL